MMAWSGYQIKTKAFSGWGGITWRTTPLRQVATFIYTLSIHSESAKAISHNVVKGYLSWPKHHLSPTTCMCLLPKPFNWSRKRFATIPKATAAQINSTWSSCWSSARIFNASAQAPAWKCLWMAFGGELLAFWGFFLAQKTLGTWMFKSFYWDDAISNKWKGGTTFGK